MKSHRASQGPVASHASGPNRMLRRPAVEAITGLGRSTIYDLMAKGRFPRPVRLTAKAVGWPETAIAEWIASRAADTN